MEPPPSALSLFLDFLSISPPLQPIIFHLVTLFKKHQIINSNDGESDKPAAAASKSLTNSLLFSFLAASLASRFLLSDVAVGDYDSYITGWLLASMVHTPLFIFALFKNQVLIPIMVRVANL